ncbi:MAG: hypothetical protein IJR57_01610 [Ruminococcus sp.]|nr:hypothetical protein [Ruminococcus sp.]
MKKVLKAIITLSLAAMMLFSSVVIASAEEVYKPDEDTVIITAQGGDGDSPKAYQLVWKYKTDGTHLWKRRWNKTLGQWYDPDWILVQ